VSVFQNIQTGSGAHPASCSMGTGFFPGGEAAVGVMLTSHLQLVPRLRMNGAIPLLPLYAFMAWTGEELPLLTLHLLKRANMVTMRNVEIFCHN
jgi:hypothetical protein